MAKRPAQPPISSEAQANLHQYRDYLDAEADVDPTTQRCYLGDLQQFAAWCETTWAEGQEEGMPFSPDQIATPLVKAYRGYLQSVVQLKPATINRSLMSIKHYCGWAVEVGLIAGNPARVVKAVHQEHAPPRHLSDREEIALMAAVEQHGTERDRVVIILLLHTGLRAEELCGLRIEHVTLGRWSGHLAIYGKRNKYREVPLNSTVRQVLEPYLAHLSTAMPYLFPSAKGTVAAQASEGGGTPEPAQTQVPATQRRSAPIGTRALGHLVAKYAKLARVPNLSPHDLRHRFGYEMAKSVPLDRLAQVMGHDSYDTTMIYIRGTPQDFQQAVEQPT